MTLQACLILVLYFCVYNFCLPLPSHHKKGVDGGNSWEVPSLPHPWQPSLPPCLCKFVFRGVTPCVCFLVGHIYSLMLLLASQQHMMHGGCCCDPRGIGTGKSPCHRAAHCSARHSPRSTLAISQMCFIHRKALGVPHG